MNDLMSAGMHRVWKDDFVKVRRANTNLKIPSRIPKLKT